MPKIKDVFENLSRVNELYNRIRNGTLSENELNRILSESEVNLSGVAIYSRKPYDVSLARLSPDFSFDNQKYDGRNWTQSHLTGKKLSLCGISGFRASIPNPDYRYPGNSSLTEKIKEFFNEGDLVIIGEKDSPYTQKTSIVYNSGITPYIVFSQRPLDMQRKSIKAHEATNGSRMEFKEAC